MKKHELILAGNGGQGLIMMGILMGQAANEDGCNVAQTQTYGIAARGGVSFSEVVISDEPIVYPKAVTPDLILTLTEETYRMFRSKYPEQEIVADDEEVSIPGDDKHAIALPLTKYCRDIGNMRVLNMLAIGVVQGFTNAISADALEKIIENRFPKARQANIAAFRKGIEMARQARAEA